MKTIMKTRREFLSVAGIALLASGCATSDGRIGVPINVTLPPEVVQIVSDAQAIVDKGKTLINNPAMPALVGQAEGLIGKLKSGSGNIKSVVAALVPVLGFVGALLPPPYNVAAGVLVAVTKVYVGQPIAGRLAMTPETARRVMQN